MTHEDHALADLRIGHRDGLCPICQGTPRAVLVNEGLFEVWLELDDGESFESVRVQASSSSEAVEEALPTLLEDFDRQTEYERWMIIGADRLRRRMIGSSHSDTEG